MSAYASKRTRYPPITNVSQTTSRQSALPQAPASFVPSHTHIALLGTSNEISAKGMMSKFSGLRPLGGDQVENKIGEQLSMEVKGRSIIKFTEIKQLVHQ
jgi:hypothetical protein